MTARPTGPQPTTRETDFGSRRALATACRPTAKGSVMAACSVGRPFGTSSTRPSERTIRSAKPPGRRLEKPRSSTPVALITAGTLTTRVPAFSVLAEPGPWSRISAQNSWPKTVSARGSKPLSGAPARFDRSIMCSMWCRACRSEPQMPQASVRTSTWPDSGSSSGISSQTSCLLRRTTALMRFPSELAALVGHVLVQPSLIP